MNFTDEGCTWRMAGFHRKTNWHGSKTTECYIFLKVLRVLYESQCNAGAVSCPWGLPRVRTMQDKRHAHSKFHQSKAQSYIEQSSKPAAYSLLTLKCTFRLTKTAQGLQGTHCRELFAWRPRSILKYNLEGKELEHLHLLQWGHDRTVMILNTVQELLKNVW